LQEARTATPHSRFRTGHLRDVTQVAGYAVTGRHARRGYVQRLAVEPEHRGKGLGSLLVLDALAWLRRWRANAAFVNTQEANVAALALYERLGFERQAEGLTVLSAPVSA
jgi:ribosomal protein S18 acetylase RimI-like enzyme